MPSFEYDLGEKSRIGSRFISHVRSEIQRAFTSEKASRKITQQQIAEKIGVNRSVINRQLMGLENMTLRSVAELLWAIGWEPFFEAREPNVGDQNNEFISIDENAGVHENAKRNRAKSTKTSTANAAFEPA